MAELYHKLSDNQAGTKKFWEMLARIRKEELTDHKASAPKGKPAKRAARKRTSGGT